MDIRIAAYAPVTVSTFSQKGNPLATSYVQNAAQSGPVPGVNAIQQTRSNASMEAARSFATTETRGTLVNILA